jgi:hypothetical protein
MQVSVRSYLTAGMAAVVGASAIAMAPVEAISAPSPVAVSVAAEVALAGITIPFTDILSLLQTLGLGGSIPDITGLVPADFLNAVGTEFLNQATPLVTTAAGGVFAYFNSTVAGLLSGPTSIPVMFGAALGAIPTVLTTAVQAVSSGDIATALQTLSTGLYAPITAIGQAVVEAGQAFQTYLTTQINTLTNALPGLLLAAVSKVITDNVQAVMASVQTAISGLLGGLVPAAASTRALVAAPAAAVTVDTAGHTAAAVTVDTVEETAVLARTSPAIRTDDAESSTPSVLSEQTVAPVTPRSRAAARRASVAEAAMAESDAPQPQHRSRSARSAR